MAETCLAEINNRKQNETTDAADSAAPDTLNDLFPGR
jgi:hypothetical protein